jgi:hypothetical protein
MLLVFHGIQDNWVVIRNISRNLVNCC